MSKSTGVNPSSDKIDDVIWIWMVLEWGAYCVMHGIPSKANAAIVLEMVNNGRGALCSDVVHCVLRISVVIGADHQHATNQLDEAHLITLEPHTQSPQVSLNESKPSSGDINTHTIPKREAFKKGPAVEPFADDRPLSPSAMAMACPAGVVIGRTRGAVEDLLHEANGRTPF